jgi:2-phosphosulfolactate phosphatase
LLVFVENGLAGCALAMERQAVAVIVDALRASANITSMFHYGTAELLVVREVEQAFRQRDLWPGAILSGERGGLPVPGFDRGNSPLQAPPDLDVRRVVFSSSNCSRCCVGVAGASWVFLGTTVNASAVARKVLETGCREMVCITAGAFEDEVRLTIEDHLAAGAIMSALEASGEPVESGNDRARLCRMVYEPMDQPALTRAFRESDNGRGLARIGLGDDVRFASLLDVFDDVPRVAEMVPLPDGGTGALVLAAPEKA